MSVCVLQDRIHRFGQRYPVKVVRFLADGTIDEAMLALQDSKAAQCKGALAKLSAAELSAARTASICSLFNAARK